MSDRSDSVVLDSCGCCEGAPADPEVRNEPALPALRYRIGTHASFLERMRRRLPLVFEDPADAPRPLQRLTTRDDTDPTMAFLDACAVVADILTFYQERIANEGFLRTATERRSVLELARSIGYELGPGVAASVHLAFTVEDAPGSPPESLVPQGTQVQSVPPQGKLPQVFETSNEFLARQEWNLLRPRLTRPTELALFEIDGQWTLHLLGAVGSFPDELVTIHGANANSLFRIDTGEPGSVEVDGITVSRVYLTQGSAPVAKGDLLLFVGQRGEAERETLILRVAESADEIERRATGDEIRRIRIDLEALPVGGASTPLAGEKIFRYVTPLFGSFSTVQLTALPLDSTTLRNTVSTQTWRENDLHALLGIQRWGRLSVMRAVNTRRAVEPVNPEAGAFAFRESVGFFGHNAPRWSSLPSEKTKGNPFKEPWDAGDVTANSPDTTRDIWTDSQGGAIVDDWDVLLERPVKGLTARMWTVFESRDEAHAFVVADARETSRADFGISGRTTGLALRTPSDEALTDPKPSLKFRTTTARVGSRRLEFAELPIDSPIDAGSTEIELDRLVLGLAAGQPIAIVGERDDLRGVNAAEIAVLADVVHAHGRTVLGLDEALQYSYVRDTVAIAANVVHATHGETVTEVLGSGIASVPNQRFALKKPPLTYVSAPTLSGLASTLEVRVNRVRWDALPSLYDADADDEVHVVRIDDDARAEVIFGDGARGARVPSGSANVTATYRSGIGPDGEVDAGTLTLLRTIPLGIRSTTNPVAAGGAEGPEQLSNARRNTPLTVVTFERIVSLSDFEDYARTYPGIGKALADRVPVDGRESVFVTVAGATGGPPGGDVLDNLISSIGEGTDQSQSFAAAAFGQRFFTVHARVVVDPRRIAADVQAAVEARLREAFGFDQREIAQSVTPSEVVARIHDVEGVLGVDLETLAEYTEGAGPPIASGQPVDPIVARRARWNAAARVFEPADLLLINPVGITIEVLEP